MKTLATLMLFSLLVIGCHPRQAPPKRAVSNFLALSHDMTLQQAIDKVGMYDRVRGSGILYYEYDFPDGSAVLLCPDLSRAAATNPALSIIFYPSTNDINLYP